MSMSKKRRRELIVLLIEGIILAGGIYAFIILASMLLKLAGVL